jgi:hypothetical protein
VRAGQIFDVVFNPKAYGERGGEGSDYRVHPSKATARPTAESRRAGPEGRALALSPTFGMSGFYNKDGSKPGAGSPAAGGYEEPLSEDSEEERENLLDEARKANKKKAKKERGQREHEAEAEAAERRKLLLGEEEEELSEVVLDVKFILTPPGYFISDYL